MPGGKLTIQGAAVTIPGLELIFEQCTDRNVPADTTGGAVLLDTVKIYHCMPTEHEAEYRSALVCGVSGFQERRPSGEAMEVMCWSAPTVPQVTAPGAEFIFRTFPARNQRGIAVSPLRKAHKLHTFPFSCSEFCDRGPPYRLTTSQRASAKAAHGLNHWLRQARTDSDLLDRYFPTI